MAKRAGLARRLIRWIGYALLACFVASIALVALFRFVPVPITSFMLQDRVGALFADEPDYRFRHDWVAWDRISANAKVAVVAAEDQKFAEHLGFDLQAIDKARKANERGRKLRGASTISQQVAKNLFLWKGRSYVRKGIEAWFTLLIEGLWPKQRILEVYLNSVEFGRGTWGIEAASQRYFGKPAARLNRSEAALLAAVLPNPIRFRVDRPSNYVRKRQRWIMNQMSALGGRQYLETLEEPVEDAR